MRIISRYLFLILISMSFASIGISASGDTVDPIVILHPDRPTKRPNAPSRNFIECRVTDVELSFILPEGINILNVSIIDANDDIVIEETVTTTMTTISISELIGDYDIHAIADTGMSYIGRITFS